MTDQLRAELNDTAHEVREVDLYDRVLVASRRASRRARRVALFSAVGAIAVIAMAMTAVLPQRGVPEPSTDPAPTGIPTSGPLPLPDPHPSAAGRWANEADPPPDSSLDGMAFTVPEWPGADPARSCAGSVTLTGGAFRPVGRSASVQLRLIKSVSGEVGGSATVVALFYCHRGETGRQFQVVAYRHQDPGRLVGVGQVLASTPDGVPAMFNVDVASGEVRVDVGDWADSLTVNEASHFSVHQWRSYAWNETAFRQSDGPTAFAANPNFHDFAVAATDLRFGSAQRGVRYATMTVTIRNQGGGVAPKATVSLMLGSPFVLRDEATTACPGGSWISGLDVINQYRCSLDRLPPQATVELVVSVALTEAEQPADRTSAVSVRVDSSDGHFGRGDTNGDNDAAPFRIIVN